MAEERESEQEPRPGRSSVGKGKQRLERSKCLQIVFVYQTVDFDDFFFQRRLSILAALLHPHP